MTARFVRTQKEMEGRYEDVWALVDETDDAETWPADAELSLVGQPSLATTAAPAQRAGSRTRSTSPAGMLHAAVLRSPAAHGRVASLDLDAALAAPGRAGRIGPESELSPRRARPLATEPLRRPADRGRRGGDARSGAAGSARARARPRGARARRRSAAGGDEQRFVDPSDDARGDAEAALAAAT